MDRKQMKKSKNKKISIKVDIALSCKLTNLIQRKRSHVLVEHFTACSIKIFNWITTHCQAVIRIPDIVVKIRIRVRTSDGSGSATLLSAIYSIVQFANTTTLIFALNSSRFIIELNRAGITDSEAHFATKYLQFRTI